MDLIIQNAHVHIIPIGIIRSVQATIKEIQNKLLCHKNISHRDLIVSPNCTSDWKKYTMINGLRMTISCNRKAKKKRDNYIFGAHKHCIVLIELLHNLSWFTTCWTGKVPSQVEFFELNKSRTEVISLALFMYFLSDSHQKLFHAEFESIN